MTIEDKNVLVQRVTRMADHAPVVIAYGNHDLPGDLDFLAKLHAVWPIFVIARPQVIEVPLATGGNAAVFVLPYPTRAGLVSAGVASGSVVDAARQALDVIFMAAAAELQEKTAQGCVPLMIGHVNVAGSIVSSGQPNIGKEIEIDLSLIQRLGNIPVALNHIHRQQYIGGAYYAGSLCRLDWGEVDPKFYLVHSAERQDKEWLFTIERRLLNVAPMYHVEGVLTRDGFDWHVQGADCAGGDACHCGMTDFAGAEVRVRYRFSANEKSALDEANVRAPFEGAKRLELDPIAVRERASRAPEVSAAVTLDQKVEAFVRRSGIAWNPGMERKLAALQQADGAAFLNQVQTELSASRHPGPIHKGDPRPEPDGHAAASADADTNQPQEVLL